MSFVSITLLIKSIALQHEANDNLKNEIKNNDKTDKLKSFEVLFFNLINSQKNLFDSFEIELENSNGTPTCPRGVKAVIAIENKIEQLRDLSRSSDDISSYLSALDADDQIFGISRAFYISVMLITEKLSKANGFSSDDREIHFRALVNFTDFSQLRLIMICVQFLNYESATYLRNSSEFEGVIKKLGLGYNLY